MKVKSFIIFIFIIILSCSKSNDKEFVARNNAEFNDIELLLRKAKTSKTITNNKKFLDSAYNIVIKQKNSQEMRDVLSKIIFEYYYLNDLESVNIASKHLLKFSEATNDSINLGVAFRSKAFYFKDRKILDSSFSFA